MLPTTSPSLLVVALVATGCSSPTPPSRPVEAPIARETAPPATSTPSRAVRVDCERGPGAGPRGGMGPGRMGMGPGPGRGMGPGPGDMREDMQQIHQLLDAHASISRKVVELPDGIESWTTSSDPAVAATLPMHVDGMAGRMKSGQLVHGFDPLFRGVFAEAANIEVIVEPLPDGVHVIERGKTPAAVALIRAHAQVVSWFQQFGMAEAHRCHDVAR
jgi:hypothetical protein